MSRYEAPKLPVQLVPLPPSTCRLLEKGHKSCTSTWSWIALSTLGYLFHEPAFKAA